MLNAIGLQNIGARAFLEEKLPKLRKMKNIVVFANIFGYSREEYEQTIEILNEGEGIAAYELNVSCPNISAGGIHFGGDPRALDEVVNTAKRISQQPLIMKLSPNVTSISQMARVAREGCADAISLVNTFCRHGYRPQDPQASHRQCHRRPVRPRHQTDRRLRMVYDAARAVKHSRDRHAPNFRPAADIVRIHAGRCHCRTDRHRQLLGSGGHRENRNRAGKLVRASSRRARGRTNRRRGHRVARQINRELTTRD